MSQQAKVTPISATSQKRNVDSSIYKTTDYTVFKRISGNRPVNQTHVNRLKESMKSHDLMIPIIVNDKMEVVDGQHRLRARQDLSIPVYYVVINGLDISDTQKANANNKNWTGEDFLNFYCEQNYFSYKAFRKFRDKYKLSMQVSLGLLVGQHFRGTEFNDGQLMLTQEVIDNAEKVAENICSIGQYYPGFKRRSFVFAIAKLINNGDFDFDDFMNKLSYQSSKMVDCTNIDQYLRIIEDIYNYKRKVEDKVRLR